MKLILTTFIASLSLSLAQAGGITSGGDEALPRTVSIEDSINAANVFIDNPELASQLKKESLSITGYEATVITPGPLAVTEFTFHLSRVCECLPKSGTLKVLQDHRPQAADGPTQYTIDLKIEP